VADLSTLIHSDGPDNMAKVTDAGRRWAVLGLVAAATVMAGGCGETPPPPPTAAEFQKAEAERKEIIRKEYGSSEPVKKPRGR
jgi:hypothetical protein